jgi:hypothetical protein
MREQRNGMQTSCASIVPGYCKYGLDSFGALELICHGRSVFQCPSGFRVLFVITGSTLDLILPLLIIPLLLSLNLSLVPFRLLPRIDNQ